MVDRILQRLAKLALLHQVGLKINRFRVTSQQGNTTGAAIVAIVAKFEFINAAKCHLAVAISAHAQRGKRDGFVQQLQAIILTMALAQRDRLLARLHRVIPKPSQCGEQKNKQELDQRVFERIS
jgi:hypothetical protein